MKEKIQYKSFRVHFSSGGKGFSVDVVAIDREAAHADINEAFHDVKILTTMELPYV